MFDRGDRPSVSIDALKAVEFEVIRGQGAAPDGSEAEPWGLALSGGGIRSATFSLGVLQALASNGLLRLFHYQSTVSGGGYIGAFLQALIHRRGLDEAIEVLRARLDDRAPPDDPDPAATQALLQARRRPIQHLREYSNYLSPRKSLVSGDTLAMAGTVVRNAVLIQLQLIALLLAASLLPLLLYWVLDIYVLQRTATQFLVAAAACCALGFVLLGFVTSSANRIAAGNGAAVSEIAMAARLSTPLLVAAALFTALAIACLAVGDSLMTPVLGTACGMLTREAWQVDCRLDHSAQLGWAAGLTYGLIWVVWWGFTLRDGDAKARAGLSAGRVSLRFLTATVIAALCSGLLIAAVNDAYLGALQDATPAGVHAARWLTMIWGPAVVIAMFAATCTIHQGLAGPAFDDLQREIWARVGGRAAALVVLCICLPLTLTILGPWLLMHLAHELWAALAGALTWIATTAFGLVKAFGKSASESGTEAPRPWMGLVVQIAPWIFILGLMLAVSLAGQLLAARVGGWSPRPIPSAGLVAYLDWLHVNSVRDLGVVSIAVTVAAAVVVWSVLGRFVNINDFGLNSFYRNRLARCYLGATNAARTPEPTTNFDPGDDLNLAAIVETPGQPGAARPLYPLIGTTLNLVATKMLDWQDRKAASFVLSPRFCGHVAPRSRANKASIGDLAADPIRACRDRGAPKPLAGALTYGSAVAISGAAVSPTMGYHSSTAVTFLLALFNVRLGWWLPNPSHKARPDGDKTPFSARWLLSETFGLTDGLAKFVHLSDGGHFENLALYELVRRQCRFIVCVDSGADPDRDFSDLANAVQKCRVDFGAQIDIDVGGLRPGAGGVARQSHAIGSIVYADCSPGTVLYIKPSLTGREPTDIQNYAHLHGRFPHEPTSDQYFSEAQFECYRRLGEYAGTMACRDLLPAYDVEALAAGTLALDAALRRRLVDALESAAAAPPTGTQRPASSTIGANPP